MVFVRKNNLFFSRLISGVAVVALSLLISGCATIYSGTTQAINIDSDPGGASVQLNGEQVGETPWSGIVKKKRNIKVDVEKVGYAREQMIIQGSFNPVALISIFWDLGTTDFLTGAMWEYSPNSFYFKLAKKGVSQELFRKEATLMAVAMTYYGDLQVELAAGTGPILQLIHEKFFPQFAFEDFLGQARKCSVDGPVAFGEALTEAWQG